jgi:gas vesicle protein
MHSRQFNESREANGSGAAMFVVGMFCGAAVGAAIALAWAPKSGSEFRRDVADSAERLRRKANDAYSSASDLASEVVSRGRRAWDAGRDAYQSAKPSAEAAVSEMLGS